MITIKTTVKEIGKKGDALAGLAKATDYLKHHMAMVGIPEGGGSHGNINNAQLLFIHTHGSPARGIPARPVIEPAIEQPDVQEQISQMLCDAMTASLDGNVGGVEASLKRAGQYGENAAKAWFTGPNGWSPLKDPYRMKGKVAKNKSGKITGIKQTPVNKQGNATPLIDTGALRASITHVVEEI